MQKPFKQPVYYLACCASVMLLSFALGKVLKHYDFQVGFLPKAPAIVTIDAVPEKPSDEWTVKIPSQAVEFIAGPLAADVGQLCVFRLNDSETRADWVIVPEATCYVDSSGSSLAFASNVPSKYTIIAAVVEEGVPKILTHICEYGLQPSPTPNPDPTPRPNPPPAVSLKDWVSQNVPEAGKSKTAALASCYESAALGIENGSIRSQEAAFSVIRTASQTKIDIEIWSTFLDGLSEKITEKLAGNNDVKTLGTIFSEIAEGLKSVSVTETQAGQEGNVAVPSQSPSASNGPAPVSRLSVHKDQRPSEAGQQNGAEAPGRDPTASWCPDPTGKACQPQPMIQYRRAR